MRKKIVWMMLVTGSLAVIGCQMGKQTSNAKNDQSVVKVDEPAVCIWDKGSVRQEPSKDGKWMSGMALGEKVVWTGEAKSDSTDDNRTYYHVRLSDGTEGWVSEYVVAVNAMPAVIVQQAAIYRRPDVITVTEKLFEPMDFVAILESKDEWIQICGEENRAKGWILSNAVSAKEDDIAVGLLASKAMQEKDPQVLQEKIDAILNNPLFANSVFIGQLKEINNEVADAEFFE